MEERSTFVFVYRDGAPVPAGRLTMIDDGRNSYALFAYGARYLRRPDAIPVDPETLPLAIGSTEARTDNGFELFNGIRDTAPDGWGRYLMQKAAGTRTLGEFDFLIGSGDHRVGALAFGPTPERPKRIAPWGDADAQGEQFDLAELLEAAERVKTIDRLDPKFRGLLEAGSSLGGATPKAATTIDGVDWIAKFRAAEDSYDVPLAEFAAMKLAHECGLTVPEVKSIRVFGKNVYLIRRFDRQLSLDAKARRVPFVSALTMLRALEIASGEYSYGDLADQIRRHGSTPDTDLRELFRRMVFNVLCGNTDDHLRNHGFLHDDKEWRLSPLYDVVPKPQVGHERSLVLALSDGGKTATLRNALAGHARFGLAREEASREIEGLRIRVAARWEKMLRKSGVLPEEIERLAACFFESTNEGWLEKPIGGWLPDRP